jgi:2TM domain
MTSQNSQITQSAMTPEDIDRLARKRAGAKLGWYIHAGVYVLVNIVLFVMASQAVDMGRRPWNIYPALGWGLGLVLHGVSVFVLGTGSGLRERMVQREKEALLRRQSGR